ncbi:hypothetical protein D3C78_878450 [compost metagenome]
MRQARHFSNGRAAGSGHAVGQVVRQAAPKQHNILTDHGDPPSQLEHVQIAQVDAIEQHLAGLWIVVALQQIDQRRLADARAAAQGDFQAERDQRIDAAQGRRAPRMAEMYGLETQLTRCRHWLWVDWRDDARGLTAQFHDPAKADGHALDGHVQTEQALHRPHRHAQISGKRDQRTELPRALHHPIATDQKRAGTGPRGQRTGDRLGEKLGHLQAQQLVHVTLPQPLQPTCLTLLLAGGLDEFHHWQRLDHER